VQSEARTVDAYLAEAPAHRRPALELIRSLCLDELAGFDESMAYGMPSYRRDGEVEVGFANQKGFIALYMLRQGAVSAARDRLGDLSVGKGTIRFRNPDQINPEVVRALLRATVADTGAIC
jgi:uncharacterized protein YdhG (YjbR/CyaY superfamily)